MYAYVKKNKESQCGSVANSIAQKKSGVKQSLGFVDNRSQSELLKFTKREPHSLHKEMEINNSHIAQRQLKINGVIHTGTSAFDTPLNVELIPFINEMINSTGVFDFSSQKDMLAFVEKIRNSTRVAKELHAELYSLIKKDTEATGGSIEQSNASTTAVMWNSGNLEVACNFAIKRNASDTAPVGRPVTLSEVVLALNNILPAGSPLALGKSVLKVHNSTGMEFPATSPISTDPKDIATHLVSVAWPKALQASIGNDWPYFAVHADVVLVARARAMGIKQPVIGVSKAPCELCHSTFVQEQIIGRSQDEGTGLKGKTDLQIGHSEIDTEVAKREKLRGVTDKQAIKQLRPAVINEIRLQVASLMNQGLDGYGHSVDAAKIEVRPNSQRLIIRIPRWIPSQLLQFDTQETDVFTIELESE